MAGRGVLFEVADAVALEQDVDWERCAERAAPAQRQALGHLRTVAGICRAAGRRAAAPAAGRDGGGFRLGSLALGALAVVALLQSVVGLATGITLLPPATEGMLSAFGGSDATRASARLFLPVSEMSPAAAFFRIVPHVLYPACGLVLLIGGRFDRRVRLLGVVFVLLGAFWAQPVVGGLGAGIYPELFLPAVLWMFVREFPRVRRRTRLDNAAARMAAAAAALAAALQVANLPPAQALSPSLAVLARDVPGAYVAPAFFGPYCVLVLAALAVLLLRARRVAPAERTRTRLFLAGLVAALAPHAEGVVEAAFPGTVTVAAANWASVLGSVSALAVPCLTMYAAISLRVLDVRTTIRVSARRLLTRGGLALLAVGPLAALGGLVASRADRPLGEVFADPLGQGCLALAGAALAALAFRERLAGVNAWIAPETADQRRVLAAAGTELTQATAVADVGAAVARAVRRGAGVPGTLLVADVGVGGYRFAAPDGSVAPLPRSSTLAGVLEELRAPLEVHPDARGTAFDLLPPEDAAWVSAAGAAAVAPVAGPGAATVGLVVGGPRPDAARLCPVDLAFLDALASASGLALERLRLEGGSGARAEEPPARECGGCGRVSAAPDAGERCAACGGTWAAAPVPAMLTGKFLLERRIGAGGMGTVYRARDVALDRPVAVKTLAGADPARLARLKREAQALAAQAHPGIAQIHGLETWRGRPLLVMEYLAGGTLAARIAEGPLAPADAAGVAVELAGALSALHAAGYRHGDVKPSNVAFTAQGTVKLLDFGLVGLSGSRAPVAGGTVPYLSPEALGGAPAAVADDVWALGVVLFEMVAGRRPFAGETADEVAEAIRCRSFAPTAPAAGSPPDAGAAVLAFAGAVLTAPRPARPATAEAFAAGLRARLRHIEDETDVRFGPVARLRHKRRARPRGASEGKAPENPVLTGAGTGHRGLGAVRENTGSADGSAWPRCS